MNVEFQRGLSVAEQIALEFDWADEPQTNGYSYHNPDSGWEWSENHPRHSGECEDAEHVRACTWQSWARRNPAWAIAHKINCARQQPALASENT